MNLQDFRRRVYGLPDVNGATGPTLVTPREAVYLLDLIDSLQSRQESLEKTKEALCKALDDSGDCLIDAGAKIESLEKDAVRYRWLRDDRVAGDWSGLCGTSTGLLYDEQLDLAIDAAMQANKGE